MVNDNTTFFLAFGAVFGVLGWYIWHLEQKVSALARRLDDAEATMDKNREAEERS